MAKNIENRIKKNFDTTHLTTFKTGGRAEYYFHAESESDFVEIIKWAKENKLPVIVIGGGSNILFTKKLIKTVVVKNSYINKKIITAVQLGSSHSLDTPVLISPDDNNAILKHEVYLEVSSGYPMSLLVVETVKDGLSGLQAFCGLPGTVGGAIYMNSKWTKPRAYIGDIVVSAKIVTRDGDLHLVEPDYFNFSYGFSRLQNTKHILLSVIFKLTKDYPDKLITETQAVLKYRKETQPYGVATAGCFFKNSSDYSAGYLIDQLGLKGYCIGDACVSDKHANFIINKGKATADDIIKLANHIKQKVKEKYKIDLKEEVEII